MEGKEKLYGTRPRRAPRCAACASAAASAASASAAAAVAADKRAGGALAPHRDEEHVPGAL